MSADGRFEEIARKARRVQTAVAGVRGSIVVPGVRIEVAADGRITALELTDPALAQSISVAHTAALAQARDRAAALRRELTNDPGVASALRRFLEVDAPPKVLPLDEPDECQNPHALPPEVRRRYGL